MVALLQPGLQPGRNDFQVQWQLRLEPEGFRRGWASAGFCLQALPRRCQAQPAESQRCGSAVVPFWGAGGRFRFIQQRYSGLRYGLGTGWVWEPGWEPAVDGLYWQGSASR